MAFFCPGAAHGSAKKKAAQSGSKQAHPSQVTSPTTPGPPSLGEKEGGGGGGGGGGGKSKHDVTISLPHSNTQAMMKKMIVVQKYEPKAGDNKGLAVNRGETVLLVRDDGEWMYVKNEGGMEGFVPKSHLLSPSTTRTRTSSRSGTALRQVASNGTVPMHSTQPGHYPQMLDGLTSPLSQDDCRHIVINGHVPQLATECLYDRKYSASSSSGVTSLPEPFSPGLTHSPSQNKERVVAERNPSSSSSLSHSRDSDCSCDDQPTLISPLNHIDRSGRGRELAGAVNSTEDLPPRPNSVSRHAQGHNKPQGNKVHYVDKTTNHVYSTLEQPTSPPPLPPRNIPAYTASQDPEHNMYSQLDHGMRLHKTRSQEALVHPSHRHPNCSEGWTRERKMLQSGNQRYRQQKELGELHQNLSGRATKPSRLTDGHQHKSRNNQTKITKFRKTVWGVFMVTHDFSPLDENEIAIRKGEHVSVWNRDDRDWFWVVKHASSSSEEGFVPSSCLREVSADSKTPTAIKSVHHNSHAPPTPTTNSSTMDEVTDPMRNRTHSHESHSSNPAQARPPRPSSGGSSRSNSQRERRSSESNVQVHRLQNREPSNQSIKKGALPPSPPSSPPPPYTEFDTNRRFMSLSQQPTEVPLSQPTGQGYGHSMHRTRSQGYVTSRNRAVHYPSSPSTPHGDRRGEMFPNEGTLV